MNSVRDPRVDVAQTVYEFAAGIDGRDWQRYRSIFVPPPADIAFDYSSYHGRPATRLDVDAWIAGITPLFAGLDATQHTMTNPLVEIADDGRTARCRMSMQAAHFLWRDVDGPDGGRADGGPEFTIGGHYDDHLVADDRGPYGWLIDAVTLTVTWRRGDERIMRLARG